MLHRLENGLTAILVENHAAPVAAMQAWVRVGSADERADEAGLAHLHEHMLFKGTPTRAPGEIARDVEARGGEINAWTSYDQTVYHLVLASRFLSDGLAVLSDALRNSLFDADELRRETEVVVEEIKRSQDMPSRRLSRDLFALAYATHPYRLPVIGTEASVRSFDRPKILSFYRRHYAPKNMVLAVVGDFEEARALEEVERLWGGKFGEPGPGAPRPPEPPQTEVRARLLRDDIREGYLSLGWHIPGLRHADVAALDLLAVILGNGDSSRLSLSVKRRQELANEAYAFSYTPNDPGLLVAGATMSEKLAAEALRGVLREVQRLRSEPPTAEELSTAQRQIESEAIYQHETVQGWARKVGFYEAAAGSLDFEAEYQQRVQGCSADEIARVAELYLSAEGLSIAGILPKAVAFENSEACEIAAKELRPLPRRASLAAARAAPDAKAKAAAHAGKLAPEPLRSYPLPGGGTLLVQRDVSVPLVAFRAAYPGGLRFETEADSGIHQLLALSIPRGAAGRDAEAISRAIDRMAGSLGASAGRNSFGLHGEFLARHFPEALSLFLDCLLRPDLAPEEVEKERELQLQEIRARDDHPSGVAFDLFSRALYRVHPYRLNVGGELAAVERLRAPDLVRQLRLSCPPRTLSLALVGDIDPDDAARRVTEALRGAPPRDDRALPTLSREPRPEEPRHTFRALDKAQSHLVVGYLGTSFEDPARYSLDVLSSVLSGQGGRLFIELRDKRSMAYSVGSFSIEGVDPGYFAVYLATSPEKAEAALAGVRLELHRVRSERIPQLEIERAKEHLIGSHEIGLQRRSASAGALALDQAYGLGPESHRHFPERIAAVTAESIREAVARFLDPHGEVVALVGPSDLTRR